MKTIKILVLILLLTEAGFGTIRYVSKTGSSIPPYTSRETASDSIQKCINICVNGDTIVVANGVYKETIVINRELTLLGSSMDSCIIDGTGLSNANSTTVYVISKSQISGFYLKGQGVGIVAAIINIEYTSVKIENIRFRYASDGLNAFASVLNCKNLIFSDVYLIIGITPYGIAIPAVVDNCVLINNLNDKYAMNITYGSCRITNNIIISQKTGANLFEGIGMRLQFIKHAHISNNLVAGYMYNINMINSAGVIDSGEVSNNVTGYTRHSSMNNRYSIYVNYPAKVFNNIIYKSADMIGGYGGEIQGGNNMFWKNIGGFGADYTPKETDLFVDPMFVNDTVPTDKMNFDFHLQRYSPAIDAGDSTVLDPDGKRSDIGMFGGPLGQIYQYLDLPPKRPSGIIPTLIPDEKRIIVRWGKNSEADTSHYIVYKDTISNFPMDSSHIFLTQKDTIFEDYFTSGTNRLYYRIKAVDKQGNMSEGSDEVAFVLTDEGEYVTEVKRDYHLFQNYPNPFNPNTVIGYQLPISSYVKVMVYDIKGELLEVLVNENKPVGYYEVEFNAGKYASGIYLYRIEAVDESGIPRFMDMKKMMLVK